MKLLRSKAILATSICIAGMLGACQHENEAILSPQAVTTMTDRNAKTTQVGQLIKDGNVDLSYNDQDPSLLWKEIFNGGTSHTEFIYTPQLITANHYVIGSNSPMKVVNYTMDIFGHCVQTVMGDKNFNYEYNDSGQLIKYYNKFQPNERKEFAYAPDGPGTKTSLSKITFYDVSGTKSRELRFSYGVTNKLSDKSPLNPDVFPIGVSKYLPVFGKFNTYLVKRVVDEKFLLNGQSLSTTGIITLTRWTMPAKQKLSLLKKTTEHWFPQQRENTPFLYTTFSEI